MKEVNSDFAEKLPLESTLDRGLLVEDSYRAPRGRNDYGFYDTTSEDPYYDATTQVAEIAKVFFIIFMEYVRILIVCNNLDAPPCHLIFNEQNPRFGI